MFNIGGGELIVILLIALIVLGPQRLPDAARQLGKAMGDLRRLSTGFQNEMKQALETADDPTRIAARRNVLGRRGRAGRRRRPRGGRSRRAAGPRPRGCARPSRPRPTRRRSRTPSPPSSAQPSAPPKLTAAGMPRRGRRRRRRPRATSRSPPRRPRTREMSTASRAGRTRRRPHVPDRAPGRAPRPAHQGRRSRVVIGMLIAFLLYNQIFEFLLGPYEDIANDRPSDARRGPAPADRSAGGLRHPHEAGALRRHRHRDAGDPLADLALRHPGPLRPREAVRRCRSW